MSKVMKDEVYSKFDEFETDEETGEVLVPREVVDAIVGLAPAETAVATEEAENQEKSEDASENTPDIEEDIIWLVEEANPEVENSVLMTEETGPAAETISETEEVVPQEEEVTPEVEEEISETEENPSEEVLPVLDFDFEFGEEEFVDTQETATDEDMILRSIDEALAAQMASTLGPVEDEAPKQKPKSKKKNIWTRIPLWCRITMIVLVTIGLLLGFFIGTKPGRRVVYGIVADYILSRTGQPETVTPIPEPTQAPITPEPTTTPGNQEDVTPTVEPTQKPAVVLRKEDYCYNVLLIGVEALPQLGGGGRSDSMILVSINSKDKKIHMTSFMRDMFVQIPGHLDNRLNAAYAKGGAELLVDTIELNLQIKIDGYVKVGFDSFEWIVDRLGGVEITLTADEAAYLRRTNYISNPANRNVVAGTQLMNGNQVLGFCRVRYVPTINGTSDDYGRTERQRTVLTKIFEKYKDSNIFTMLSIFNDCLPMVTTNISKTDMQNMMEMVVEERILTMDTMRLPIAGGFDGTTVILDGLEAQVLAVQWSKNIKALHEFIFGPEE